MSQRYSWSSNGRRSSEHADYRDPRGDENLYEPQPRGAVPQARAPTALETQLAQKLVNRPRIMDALNDEIWRARRRQARRVTEQDLARLRQPRRRVPARSELRAVEQTRERRERAADTERSTFVAWANALVGHVNHALQYDPDQIEQLWNETHERYNNLWQIVTRYRRATGQNDPPYEWED